MANIEDLSKGELLGLIYHLVPTTLTRRHPCFCACCGDGYNKDKEYEAKPYWYLCDNCEASLSNEENYKVVKTIK
jgi:hypothetical protein